ncbi:MAG: DUF2177 family protein [Burkholderiales bacterium]|nr:MAG: DUF2177 family protein [Betaproteobacteria bacterium]TAG84499.1 MAG: DUF2177 family protein [Burkholderiales bacterium]
MHTSTIVSAILGIAITLLTLDLLWLKFAMGPIFRAELGDWVRPNIGVVPAALFYVFYVVGIYVFAVRPALVSSAPLAYAIGYGSLLGLVAYGAYDLTNLATLRAWTPRLAMIDMAWGTFLTAAASTAGMAAARLIENSARP